MRYLLICLSFVFCLPAVAGNDWQNKIKQKIQFPSPTLEMVLEFEDPTPYQTEQIRALVDKATAAARAKFGPRLSSRKPLNQAEKDELILFLNRQLLINNEDTPLLKWAFPAQEGETPKGSLDCDSRTFLVMACLEKLGSPLEKVFPVSINVGHVILYADGAYYDLTTNEIVDTSDNKLTRQHLDTPKKQKSLLFTNNATVAMIESGYGDVFRNSRDKSLSVQGENLYKKALEFFPDNLVALFNLKNITRGNPTRRMDFQDQILRAMTANYLGGSRKDSQKITQSDIIKVVASSNAMTNIMLDFIGERMQDPQAETVYIDIMIAAGRNPLRMYDLEKAENLLEMDRFEEMTLVLDQVAVALNEQVNLFQGIKPTARELRGIAGSLGGLLPEEGFSSSEWKAISKMVQKNLYVAANNWMVAQMISGQQPPNRQELEKKNYPILQRILKGERVSFDYVVGMEKFFNWKGCRDYLIKLGVEQDEIDMMCSD